MLTTKVYIPNSFEHFDWTILFYFGYYFRYSYHPSKFGCWVDWSNSLSYSVTLLTLVFLIPAVFQVCIYIHILKIAQRKSQKITIGILRSLKKKSSRQDLKTVQLPPHFTITEEEADDGKDISDIVHPHDLLALPVSIAVGASSSNSAYPPAPLTPSKIPQLKSALRTFVFPSRRPSWGWLSSFNTPKKGIFTFSALIGSHLMCWAPITALTVTEMACHFISTPKVVEVRRQSRHTIHKKPGDFTYLARNFLLEEVLVNYVGRAVV